MRTIADIAALEKIDVTQARRLLRLTLLGPAVVESLLANPDVAINLESVLRRVMPLDWQAQGAVHERFQVVFKLSSGRLSSGVCQ